MTRKVAVGRKVVVVVLVLAILGGVVWAFAVRGTYPDLGARPPAPQAPMAPNWPAPIPAPAKEKPAEEGCVKPGSTSQQSPESKAAGGLSTEDGADGLRERYGWPADFHLPLIIQAETPEVPDRIRGPSPPIVPKPATDARAKP